MTSKPTNETEWFRDWFDDDYLDLYRHRNREEARRFLTTIRDRLQPQGHRGVADLACGAGRHAWILAEDYGWPVVGLDLSITLLRRARAEHQDANVSAPRFVRGDLRALPLQSRSFPLVLNLFTSFGYFIHEDEHQRVLNEIERILAPGGLTVIDLMNPAPTLANLVPEDESQRGQWHVTQSRRYVPETQRIVKTINLKDESGRTRTVRESVRIFPPDEFITMLGDAGLHLRERWGSYDASPFDEQTSDRQICIVECA